VVTRVPIRQRDAHRGHLRARAWGLDKAGAEVEQLWPLARVLSDGDLAVGAIDQGIGPIAEQALERSKRFR